MKKVFIRWFNENYGSTKSEWAWQVHVLFLDWYNHDHIRPANCTVKQVKKWLIGLGVILADGKIITQAVRDKYLAKVKKDEK